MYEYRFQESQRLVGIIAMYIIKCNTLEYIQYAIRMQ